ncbi:908_t:CDS:1 [Paraglomus occultum]|uniref:908_t:CDS:1 n=1 Tax=Paraglomus occultum TaxID=144539 RepID=A0A9N9D6G4_9GLOM|nr:908_t:CDS:1 [Paraglomus occultum]
MYGHRGINLLCSPPSSGKTTLSKLLQNYLINKKHDIVRISMSTLERYPRSVEGLNCFDEFFRQVTRNSFSSLLSHTSPTDIIIDECQVLYDQAEFFWALLKDRFDHPIYYPNSTLPSLCILLLSMYEDCLGAGSKTPLDFPDKLGLDDLCLTHAEFNHIVGKFTHNALEEHDFEFVIEEDVTNAILTSTRGHASLVMCTLELLQNYCQRNQYKPENKSTEKMLTYMVSPGYFATLQETRVLDWIKALKLTKDVYNFLHDAFTRMDKDSPQNLLVPTKTAEYVMVLIRPLSSILLVQCSE